MRLHQSLSYNTPYEIYCKSFGNSCGFKVKVVLEALKEIKSINEISSENKIHPSVLNRWKNEAIKNLPEVFSDRNKKVAAIKSEYEKTIMDLYKNIGILTTKLNALQSKSF